MSPVDCESELGAPTLNSASVEASPYSFGARQLRPRNSFCSEQALHGLCWCSLAEPQLQDLSGELSVLPRQVLDLLLLLRQFLLLLQKLLPLVLQRLQ